MVPASGLFSEVGILAHTVVPIVVSGRQNKGGIEALVELVSAGFGEGDGDQC